MLGEEVVRPEFDSHSGTYCLYHGSDNTWKMSSTIVLALSSITGDEPTQMLPLYDAVDPDALDSLVRGRERGAAVSFEFHGFQVTVRDDGRITLTPLEETT